VPALPTAPWCTRSNSPARRVGSRARFERDPGYAARSVGLPSLTSMIPPLQPARDMQGPRVHCGGDEEPTAWPMLVVQHASVSPPHPPSLTAVPAPSLSAGPVTASPASSVPAGPAPSRLIAPSPPESGRLGSQRRPNRTRAGRLNLIGGCRRSHDNRAGSIPARGRRTVHGERRRGSR
jgi:hypothetical protein